MFVCLPFEPMRMNEWRCWEEYDVVVEEEEQDKVKLATERYGDLYEGGLLE